jgi:hypothetical protein
MLHYSNQYGDLSLLVPPHPKRRASLSAYWSGSALVGGKQIGATVLENITGVSSVIMAISLA